MMFFWVLVSNLVGQEYFVSVGAGDDVSCLHESGCNLATFKKLQAKVGDRVHLRDSVLTRSEFVEVFGVMRDDFSVSGAPTMIVEKGRSSTVSDEYLMAVESCEISVNGVSFVDLRCPILRAIKSKVTFQGCSVEGVRSMNSATLLMVDSRCDFVAFRFLNNSLKQTVFVNISGSDVRFHNASFEDNFHSGSKEWSFVHCWQSNVVFEMCSLTKTPVKQYSVVARGSSNVTVQDWYVNGVRGVAIFGIMESSMLNVVGCMIASAECSAVHAVHSQVEITGMIVVSLRCQKHMFSLSTATMKLTNSDIRQVVLSTVLNTQGKTSVEVDHVTITESVIKRSIAVITGGELTLHNSVIKDIQAPNTTSVCRLTDGRLAVNNMSITRVNNASNGTPMIWLTDSFATIENALVKDNIGSFLWSSASTPLVKYCTFENHICPSTIDSALPQGILSGLKESMLVHGCTFRHCVTSAGIISSSLSSIDITDCFFENCTGFRGVAVISDHSATDLRGCTFLNNYAHSVGIVYGIECQLSMNSCYFDGNRAAVTGSAVYCVGAFQLSMNNVSTGNNQTSIIASPVKYGLAHMKDCNVSHSMEEAIEIPKHRVQFENTYFDCRHNCSLGSMPKRSFRGRMTPLERVNIAREELEECFVQNGIGIFPENYASHVSRQDAVFQDNKPALSVRGLYKHMVVGSAGKILIPKFGLVILVPLILVIFSANFVMQPGQDKPKTE